MSLKRFLIQPITIQRFTVAVDRYGDSVPQDWSSVPTEQTVGWISQQDRADAASDGASESLGRDATVDRWLLMFDVDVKIEPRDRVLWLGDVFEVIGDPRPCYKPRGLHHYEATLRRVKG